MSIVTPRADQREQTLENLDWSVTCEHSWHPLGGEAPPSAEFCIRKTPLAPCGCPHKSLLLVCAPCLQRRYLGLVVCNACRQAINPRLCDLSIEHL